MTEEEKLPETLLEKISVAQEQFLNEYNLKLRYFVGDLDLPDDVRTKIYMVSHLINLRYGILGMLKLIQIDHNLQLDILEKIKEELEDTFNNWYLAVQTGNYD